MLKSWLGYLKKYKIFSYWRSCCFTRM